MAVAIATAACGGGGNTPADDEDPTCEDLRAQYAAIVATLDQSCEYDQHCTSIGATDTCNCYGPVSGHCEGYPFRGGALTLANRDALFEIDQDYRARGCGRSQGECDCAPQPLYCRNNTCVTGFLENVCNAPPDAAIEDAAVDADPTLPDATPL